jgi:hypothetical protein
MKKSLILNNDIIGIIYVGSQENFFFVESDIGFNRSSAPLDAEKWEALHLIPGPEECFSQ